MAPATRPQMTIGRGGATVLEQPAPSQKDVGTSRFVRGAATIATIMAIAVLAGCTTTSASSDLPAEAVTITDGPATVAVTDNAFEPAHVAVEAGTTVTWNWQGSAEHNVVAAAFYSPTQSSETFTHRFRDPGTYEYRCTLHPGMNGTVTVLAP